MTYSDPSVLSIRAITTGNGAQHKEHRFGTRLPLWWWLLTSQSWVDVPVLCFLIEHRDGLILFDTGLDPAIKSDPNYIDSGLGRFLLNRIFRLKIGSADGLGPQLTKIGYRPSDIKKAVLSHLHFDHIGGIADIPQADLIVARDEWVQLSEPHPEHKWILAEHIQLPNARWHPIDFAPTDDPLFSEFGRCYDLMGDGALILLPTPGHTKGSLSMLVQSVGRAPVLLIGDLAYQANLLMKDQLPGIGDKDELRRSFAKVRDLKAKLPGLKIIASHDPVSASARD